MLIQWDGHDYQYDPRAIDVKTAMVIKDRTGWGMRTWEKQIDDGDPLALQLLLWAIKGQNDEPCDPSQLNFSMSDFYGEINRAAVAELSEQIKAEEAKSGKAPAAKGRRARTAKPTPTSSTTEIETFSDSPTSAT